MARNRATIAAKRLRGVHPTASIHHTAEVSRDLRADRYVFIGTNCWIAPMTTIGAYSMLAPNVAIVGGDHVWDAVGIPMQFAGRAEQLPTRIGRDVWLGRGVILQRGVTIGDGAIVGAGSVVTRDVPEYEIWAGSPARELRARFSPDEQERHRVRLDSGQINPTFAPPLERFDA